MTLYSKQDLLAVFNHKYRRHGPDQKLGWGPQLRLDFGYFTPDDIYETAVAALVTEDTEWLDVGCGRAVFPHNFTTAKLLAEKCRLLVGLDPSDNIKENQIIHRHFQGLIEDFDWDQQFDLVTLRMVAEHITNPEVAVAALGRICKSGGRVVIYTVYRWSPVTLISDVTPFSLHHHIKRFLWGSKEKDTFPTAYKMNTRRALAGLFQDAGFDEEEFRYLDDCRSFSHWKFTNMLELSMWKVLAALRLHYPEVCVFGIYRKR